MLFYQEITLIDQVEISPYFIWSKLYGQLHLALVEIKDADSLVPVGVSFAEYRHDEKHSLMGSKLRVFASDMNHLERLNLNHWFNRLSDYAHISSIRAVPNEHGYVVVSRVHTSANVGNLARRYAKRHSMSIEAALELYKNYDPKQPTQSPFIKLKSLSSANDFVLCIQQSPAQSNQVGKFSTYGLSSTSTVPHW